MSLASDVKTVLAADAALIDIFGTLIITYDDLGDLGLNRNSFPSAFDTEGNGGELKPIMIIRDRDQNSTFEMRGEDEQLTSTLQAVEIVTYCSRFTGYTILDTALARVYALLHDRNAGTNRLRRRNNVTGQREPMLNFACLQWSIYESQAIVKPA